MSFTARAFAFALACCIAACDDSAKPTQVMAVIDADPSVRERIRDLELQVKSGTGPVDGWEQRFAGSLTGGGAAIQWPVEVALVPREGRADQSYLVEVTARGESGGAIAQLRMISGYVVGKVLTLPLVFDQACVTRDRLCDSMRTCRAGSCVDPHVPASSLLPFVPGQSSRLLPASGAGGSATAGAGAGGTAGAAGMSIGEAGSDAPVNPPSCEAGTAGCAPVPPTPIDCPNDVCKGCPEGFAVGSAGGCVPLLTGLSLSAGELVPALNATETRYQIDLPLLRSEVVLAPLAADGVHIELNGAAVEPGATLALSHPELGEATVAVALTHAQGSRTYNFTVARHGAQRSYLKARNGSADDGFGASVDAAGELVVVGAPGEDSADPASDGEAEDDRARNSGAVYVFVREGASFSQVARLKANMPLASEAFGATVSLSGDRIAVGAPGRDAGAVYVFVRDGAAYRQEARLLSTMPSSGGRFGESVALDGDTLVVGAIEENGGATRAGAAYVFVRGATGWSSGVQLRSSRPQSDSWFGARVTLRDGVIVVGATGETHGALTSGAAHVFVKGEDGSFRHDALLIASDTGPLDFMGEAVAVSHDTIAVGAPGASPTANSAGAVYIFTRADGEWTRTARLTAGNPGDDAAFGVRIALRGDQLIATALHESSAATGINSEIPGTMFTRSGAAYLFERREGEWSQVAHIKADRPGAGDLYGSWVALLGDAVILGAEGEASTARGVDGNPDDDGAPASGAVYVVR